jgi:hypothetical protein
MPALMLGAAAAVPFPYRCPGAVTQGRIVGLFIETREYPTLPAIVSHVTRDARMDAIFLHGPQNAQFAANLSRAFRRVNHPWSVTPVGPEDEIEVSHATVGRMLLDLAYWRLLRCMAPHASHVLTFSPDTMTCGGRPSQLAAALEYDYCGSPHSVCTSSTRPRCQRTMRIGNSGFSTARIDSMLRLLEAHATDVARVDAIYAQCRGKYRKHECKWRQVEGDAAYFERSSGFPWAPWLGHPRAHSPWLGDAPAIKPAIRVVLTRHRAIAQMTGSFPTGAKGGPGGWARCATRQASAKRAGCARSRLGRILRVSMGEARRRRTRSRSTSCGTLADRTPCASVRARPRGQAMRRTVRAASRTCIMAGGRWPFIPANFSSSRTPAALTLTSQTKLAAGHTSVLRGSESTKMWRPIELAAGHLSVLCGSELTNVSVTVCVAWLHAMAASGSHSGVCVCGE